MKTRNGVLAGALLGALLATPIMAAEDVCLQANRLWGWQALDNQTLLVTDRNYRRYTVKLTGGCIDLAQYAGMPLVFRTRTSLGCVARGDRVSFRSPALGPLSCFVTSVEAAPPAADSPAPADSAPEAPAD